MLRCNRIQLDAEEAGPTSPVFLLPRRPPLREFPRKLLTLEPIPGSILTGMSATPHALRSGQLASLAGVSPDTVRYYERIGVLPQSPRTASGYRMYPRDAVNRVLLVRRALQLGFTLKELTGILRVRDGGGAPCHRVLSLTEAKLRSLEHQIQELRRTQRYMRQLVRQWRLQLSHTPPGTKAMLLHSLADKPMPHPKSGSDNFKRRQRP